MIIQPSLECARMTEQETIMENKKQAKNLSNIVSSPMSNITIEEMELIQKIKAITARGNDVEIRQKRDGKMAIYEIKKKIV